MYEIIRSKAIQESPYIKCRDIVYGSSHWVPGARQTGSPDHKRVSHAIGG